MPTPPLSHYIYDIETYPNLFSVGAIHHETGTKYTFEISDRMDQSAELMGWLYFLQVNGCFMVGFNNVGFDYPIIHNFMKGHKTAQLAYLKCQQIIGGQSNQDRFAHTIWERDRFIKQIDLFLIHHFDNASRRTSLKAIEFAMRMESIQDLPYAVGSTLTHPQIQDVVDYMHHDIKATHDFFKETLGAIEFRRTLSAKYGHDFTNYNDGKIGKQFFIMKLEEAGVPCFTQVNGRKQKRQTPRPNGIKVEPLILPFICFARPELKEVHQWFKDMHITNTKGKTKRTATVDGFTFDFGLGGIHGSINSALVESDKEYVIIDVDVTSYYPSVPIKHRIYPEHLSEKFCDIYDEVKQERLKHRKGSPENLIMKLSLNSVYGDSNSEYSPFYDPQFTMSVTINGQLMLAMLAEWVMAIPNLTMIQANTDGITVRLPRVSVPVFNNICGIWEQATKLDLEHAEYSRMWIRDVNNYVAEYSGSGECKCKGAYSFGKDRLWHQDHSQQVVPMMALEHMRTGESIERLVRNHKDPCDFMRRAKVARTHALYWGGEDAQRISRYFVTTEGIGRPLTKKMPLTDNHMSGVRKKIDTIEGKQAAAAELLLAAAKAGKKPPVRGINGLKHKQAELIKAREELKTGVRESKICGGHPVWLCNNTTQAHVPIDYDFYIEEVKKLTEVFK